MKNKRNEQITPLVPDDIYAPFDDENPYALVNLVPQKVREAIENLDPIWYKLSEAQTRARCQPSAEVARVRLAFWDEYLRAIDQNRTMTIESILKGFCAKRIFYEDWLNDPKKMAYILCPPANYGFALREMLELGWDQLREVLSLPIKEKVPFKDRGSVVRDEKGDPIMIEVVNHATIEKILKITMVLDQRVKGAIVQRMQVDQRNLNVNVDGGESFQAPQSMDQLEAMSKKIELLKKDLMDVELLTNGKEDSESAADDCGPIILEAEASPAPEEQPSGARTEDPRAEAGNNSGAAPPIR